MKVRYTGPIDEVTIRDFDLTVKRNHQLKVPDAIGQRLIEQADWDEVGKSKSQDEAPAETTKQGG